ncbi:MAG: flagellin, partial [Roseomonas sp.]|nr:flagellin [Roseomonas sp.]
GVIAVGEQLGGVKGILQTTCASLSVVSDTMKQVRAVLTRLADAAINESQRTTYEEQYSLLTGQVASFIDDAFYNGRTLLSTNAAAGGGDITGIRNEGGGTFTIESIDGEALKLDPDAFVITTAQLTTLTAAAQTKFDAQVPPPPTLWAGLTPAQRAPFINAEIFNEKVTRATDSIQFNGAFDVADRLISTALNEFGAAMNFVDNQIKYNSQKVDAMELGLGALIDADLAKESSTLEALKVRQQLGVQTLGLANQGPQVLLGLFR